MSKQGVEPQELQEVKHQLIIISDDQVKEIVEVVISSLEKTGYFGPELLSLIRGHVHEGIAEYSEAFSPEKSLEIIEQWEKKVKFYKEKIQHEYYLRMGDSDYNLDEIARDLINFYNEQHTTFKSALKLAFFEIMSPEVRLRDKDDYRLQEWIWKLMVKNGEKMNGFSNGGNYEKTLACNYIDFSCYIACKLYCWTK